MSIFSEEQIIALAPDEGSAKSGRELANARKWVNYFVSNANRQSAVAATPEQSSKSSVGAAHEPPFAVWGECQGSGSKPYQTCIDLNGPAFKCTCPSRKFPCKHGLGLLLLFTKELSSFADVAMPDWVSAWMQSRQERQEKAVKKKENAGDAVVDEEARAKRQSNRIAKVEAGISEFQLFLQDRIRQGLSGIESQSYQYWERMAARLTDAQAPGLARGVRQCAGQANSGEGWQSRLLDQISQLHLAAEAFQHIDKLDLDLQQDLRNLIGFNFSQEQLLKEDGIKDTWQVLGQRIDVDDRLKTQRTWLRGESSKQWALVLSFAFGVQPLDISLLPGERVEAELVFFPGKFALRALVKNRTENKETLSGLASYNNANEFLEDYSRALSLNPWLDIHPLAVDQVIAFSNKDGEFCLVDRDRNLIPTNSKYGIDWQILSITGGHPFTIFGEWNGDCLLPLSIFCANKFQRLDLRLSSNVA